MAVADAQLIAGSAVGVAGGLALLVRGMLGYQAANRIADTSTSAIESLAVGEVRVSGVVEPAEVSLRSPLQSVTCVYYRSQVREQGERSSQIRYRDERSVGFRVRDPTGSIRVFPRGARFDVPLAFDEHSGLMGGEPPGLDLRAGPAVQAGQQSREEQIAALLTVHRSSAGGDVIVNASLSTGGGVLAYQEARIAPGDTVTIVGQAVRFDQLDDPAGADAGGADSTDPTADPEVAADLAAAQESGTLATDRAHAWGNAAIPGFGIGRPATAPTLDPDATPETLATPAEASEAARTFDLAPDSIVLARTAYVDLSIALGPPAMAAARQENRFYVGLLGAVVSIAAAVVLALAVTGRV